MSQFVIENPIINSPFRAPTRHHEFSEDGGTATLVEQRRRSSYFIPIATPRRRVKQQTFDQVFADENRHENDDVNRIRSRVGLWRDQGYPDITPVTRNLLEYWKHPQRDRRLFFCQIEAMETLIFFAEVAERGSDVGLVNWLREQSRAAGSSLFRQACKMATGSGKTVVMAMLIAWQTLNKQASTRDKRFADAFLIVTPASPSATGCECCCPPTRTTIINGSTSCRRSRFRTSVTLESSSPTTTPSSGGTPARRAD